MPTESGLMRTLSVENAAYDELDGIPPSKVIEPLPSTKWSLVRANLRLPSLEGELGAFAWRIVNNVLPCESVLSRTVRNTRATCRFSCPGNPTGDLQHCFFLCQRTVEMGDWLLDLIKRKDPSVTVTKILTLDVIGEESTIWVLIHCLLFIWKSRTRNQTARPKECLITLNAALDSLVDRDIAIEARALIRGKDCNTANQSQDIPPSGYFEKMLPKSCLEESLLQESDCEGSEACNDGECGEHLDKKIRLEEEDTKGQELNFVRNI